MTRTRWLLLLIGLLVLTSAGCAKRDWVSDLLVLTDVTGTWEGTVKGVSYGGSSSNPLVVAPTPIRLVLQQRGPKVTGELSWSRGQGLVEGVVNGEVLTFSEGIKSNWPSTVMRCGAEPRIHFSLAQRPVDLVFSASGV